MNQWNYEPKEMCEKFLTLPKRMEARGWKSEWADVRAGLNDLEEFEVQTKGERFVIRSRTTGEAGKAIQSAGIALGPAVRFKDAE